MANFNRGRSGDGRSFGKRDFGRDRHRPQMYEAVCSNCGKECQIPFKPTGEKPVYCRDCFAKMNGGDSKNNFARKNRNERPISNQSGRSPSSDQQLREINIKLDKILELLYPRVQTVAESTQEDMPIEAEVEKGPEKVKKPSKKATELQ